ncbi:MAG: ABC transporter substrate-binding protein [Alphaproteobacteria bacterium]|nr:ABC transporter substrate-binding protein [Alphaproteobacteria bacterium]
MENSTRSGTSIRAMTFASVAAAALAVTLTAFAQPALAETERTVKIAGWGAKSGPLRSFGVNSEAVLTAAVQAINDAGGVKLGDGTMAKMELTYYDSACNADQAISVARKVESQTEALIGIGPTCSGAAAAMYGIFQKTVGDASDTGLQFPILTDTAIRPGLAKKSQWTFRNVPNEIAMYDALFEWLRTQYPDAETIYGGTETDQAHSRLTFALVIVPMAKKHGFEWVGGGIEGVTGKVGEGRENVMEASKSSNWLMADTNFSVQARAFKKSGADMMIISSHPFTTCGMLKEMKRQRINPKVLVGLTSSSSAETLKGCSDAAEGMYIPTGFAPITEAAAQVAALAEANGGSADLHSAAAWENAHIIKQVVEATGVMAKPDTLVADRRKVRDGLEALANVDGLMGAIGRVQDEGESIKPYVFVQADAGSWTVVHDPR